jgi:hypothetical protein
MIENNQKTSLLVSSQLPEFVRDDPQYANFVLFLKAYYEWLEQEKNISDRTKNLLNYADIDKTPDEFVDYFYNEFLSYFPKDILADKTKVTKIAKELYKSKGTPASYEFLFRVLYDSPVEFFLTKDAVLRASDGEWYISKSLNIASDDVNFLNIKNYSVFGETTKSLATIENSSFDGTKTIIYISNIQRDFQSGEYIRILDSNNQEVQVNGQPLRAKIVGQVNRIDINPDNRGLLYRPGDPVGIIGGLNSNTGQGAAATVYATTKGSLSNIRVIDGGYGYRSSPNTTITITPLSSGAQAVVSSVDPNPRKTANVTLIPADTIQNQSLIKLNANNYNFVANGLANLNCSLANAFNFLSFTTYPISAVFLNTSGTGLSGAPTITASSLFPTDNVSIIGDIRNLGILAPIQIENAGNGYRANDTIVLTGGSGTGAHANIISVNANGSIIAVDYTYENPNSAFQFYPLGGSNYQRTSVPIVTIISSNVAAANAVLTIPGILGDGATFGSTYDRVGAISSIDVSDPGADYVQVPSVTLKVQDLCVNNVFISDLPQSGDILYQGTSQESATYFATVDSIESLYPFANTAASMYKVRVLNYNTTPDYNQKLKVKNKNIYVDLTNRYSVYNVSTRFDSTGVITYGDGTAKANAIFINGLVSGTGQYIGTRGQLSSFDVLQSQDYNNYTYQITLEKEISNYRDILLNLLHPTGTKVLGRFVIQAAGQDNFTTESSLNKGHTLGYYTGNPGSYVTMVSDWTNGSNNIINFNSLAGANIESFIFPNSSIKLTLSNGFEIYSEVTQVYSIEEYSDYINISDCSASPENIWNAVNSIDFGNNIGWTISESGSLGYNDTIILKDNVWLTYANVAYVSANSGNTIININSLTNSYDIINNGNYSNVSYPLKDIVYAGDYILVPNNTEKLVSSVDYVNGKITLSTTLANTVGNSFMSVRRTVSTNSVQIDGVEGYAYYPEITDEYGNTITTEDDVLILLG